MWRRQSVLLRSSQSFCVQNVICETSCARRSVASITATNPFTSARYMRVRSPGYLSASVSLPSAAPTMFRAHYAKKGKKGKHDDDDEKEDAIPYDVILKQVKTSLTENMNRSIDYLREEMSKLRLGRANPDILNKVKVNGVPITKKANIFVRDPLTLSVIPFEKTQSKDIVQAIISAELDLAPQMEADSITIRLPKATKEARDSLIKQLGRLCEELKASLRRSRHSAMDDLKRRKDSISKDDFRKLETEVQKVTDDFGKKVDQLHKAKEKDIQDN